jgi:acyl-CoA thioesterase-1
MRGSDIEIACAARRAFAVHCSALVLGAGFGAPASAWAAASELRLLVVGDSLSAEYGLPRGSGWVALLQQKLAQERPKVSVINASISGDTTSGGRSRLPALLALHRPRIVVIELGGNDALRGLPLTMTQANLRDMARKAKASGAKVVIVGIAVPPNYGRKYADEFVALFGAVARAEGAGLVPFLLAGVADGPQAQEQFQADGIHPKAQAHPQMLANVWPVLKPLLGD